MSSKQPAGRRESDQSRVQFGEFELDRGARQLLRVSQPVELSARGFDLICLLIDHAERAVSRQEVLDQLWGDRVVTDNTLSQLVSSVRRALDDSADQARFVRTVHGFGLQWVGGVEPVAAPMTQDLEQNQPGATSQSSADSPAQQAGQTANQIPSQTTTRRFPIGASLLLVGLLAIAIGFWLGQQRSGSVSPITRQSGQVIVAVLPLTSTEQAETELLSLAITDYLTDRLRAVPNLLVLAPDELSRFLAEPSLSAVRSTIDPDFIFEGRLTRSEQAEQAWLEARVVPRGGEIRALAQRQFALPDIPNDFAYFFNARQALVEELAAVVSPGNTLPSLGSAEPNDPEALRIGLSADRLLRSSLCDHQGLDSQLQSAIAKAPESAYLWWLLGNHYFTRVWGCGEPVGLLDQAFAAAARADQLAPGRYAAETQLRHTYLLETARAEQAYELALADDLSKPDALYRLALTLRYAGFIDAAASYREQLMVIDPLYFFQGRYGRAPNSMLYQGEWTEFAGTIPLSGPYHSYYHGFVGVLENQPDQARSVLQRAFSEFPSDMFGSLSRALLAHLEGDNRLAIEVVRQVAAGRARLPLRDGEVTYKQAQLLALSGDIDGSLLALEQTIEQGFFCAICFATDPSLAAVRSDSRYPPLLERSSSRHQAFAVRFGLASELLQR